jgi:hypothetical protein
MFKPSAGSRRRETLQFGLQRIASEPSATPKLSINSLRDHWPPNEQPYWRGVGGRGYGTSEDIETLQGKNNPSTSRLRAVKECGSSLARRSQFARIIRSCHRPEREAWSMS